LLTDHLNHDASGREWGERVTHTSYGVDADGTDTRIRCFASPLLAALLNGLERTYRIPRLWEASVETDAAADSAIVLCSKVTITRQATLPTLSGMHYARFAVLAAQSACEGTRYEEDFVGWAGGWLTGEDSSGAVARELAEGLERDARPGQDPELLTLPLPLMLANAARAAMHASKLSWLVGRARDEESARALACAGEAVRTALRMRQLDLGGLALEAAPRPSSTRPVTPLRVASPLATDRILRALPT
jgi:hypothetical protein